MSARIDDEALVLEVACLVEDRAPEEQRAMLATALRIDAERSAFVSANYRGDRLPIKPYLTARVEGTYEPSEGKRVALSVAQLQRWERMMARWNPCDECGAPVGAHLPGCPVPVPVQETP